MAENLICQLDRFGDNAKQLIAQDHFALSYQSHWSVPDEIGECQSLNNIDGTYFLFHSRVDNRQTLFNELARASLEDKVSKTISDEALVYSLLMELGENAIEFIVGAFVFVRFDPHINCVLMALRC